jgi:hypothetical protein
MLTKTTAGLKPCVIQEESPEKVTSGSVIQAAATERSNTTRIEENNPKAKLGWLA